MFTCAPVPGKVLKEEKWGKNTTFSLSTGLRGLAEAHYFMTPLSILDSPCLILVAYVMEWPRSILLRHALWSPYLSHTRLLHLPIHHHN